MLCPNDMNQANSNLFPNSIFENVFETQVFTFGIILITWLKVTKIQNPISFLTLKQKNELKLSVELRHGQFTVVIKIRKTQNEDLNIVCQNLNNFVNLMPLVFCSKNNWS